MNELGPLLSGPLGELGFGGVAGAIVGYTAKKVTKLMALALGLVFIAIQTLVYLKFVTVDWPAVQNTAEHVWNDRRASPSPSVRGRSSAPTCRSAAASSAGFALGFKFG